MTDKLKCVLLVDDNSADNYLHKLVIEESACAEEVATCKNGEEALEYLKKTFNTIHYPSLILLDINMPRMNGWEFLEEYRKLPRANIEPYIVFMLTTSLNPDDRHKSESDKKNKRFFK